MASPYCKREAVRRNPQFAAASGNDGVDIWQRKRKTRTGRHVDCRLLAGRVLPRNHKSASPAELVTRNAGEHVNGPLFGSGEDCGEFSQPARLAFKS